VNKGVWFTAAGSKDMIFHPSCLENGSRHWHRQARLPICCLQFPPPPPKRMHKTWPVYFGSVNTQDGGFWGGYST